jgi:hypothetical protein
MKVYILLMLISAILAATWVTGATANPQARRRTTGSPT